MEKKYYLCSSGYMMILRGEGSGCCFLTLLLDSIFHGLPQYKCDVFLHQACFWENQKWDSSHQVGAKASEKEKSSHRMINFACQFNTYNLLLVNLYKEIIDIKINNLSIYLLKWYTTIANKIHKVEMKSRIRALPTRCW